MKSIEIRNYIKVHGDEGVVKVLEQHAARMSGVEASLRDMGAMLDMMSSIVGNLAQAAEGMDQAVKQMRTRVGTDMIGDEDV